jgi:hypothetical protein
MGLHVTERTYVQMPYIQISVLTVGQKLNI